MEDEIIIDTIIELTKEKGIYDTIHDEQSLRNDLCLSSFDMIILIHTLEERLGKKIDLYLLENVHTVGQLKRVINNA